MTTMSKRCGECGFDPSDDGPEQECYRLRDEVKKLKDALAWARVWAEHGVEMMAKEYPRVTNGRDCLKAIDVLVTP
jgi:hypothetical protein